MDDGIDGHDGEKCCKRDIVLVPAAVALGSGQDVGERNKIDCRVEVSCCLW